jgi:hypothetical protein
MVFPSRLSLRSACSFATWQWFALKPASKPQVRDPLLQLAMVYRWVALVMSLWWVCEYINERERIWVFALVGCSCFCSPAGGEAAKRCCSARHSPSRD